MWIAALAHILYKVKDVCQAAMQKPPCTSIRIAQASKPVCTHALHLSPMPYISHTLQARAGSPISNDEIETVAKLFRDELTLDNLERVHLVGMAQVRWAVQ